MDKKIPVVLDTDIGSDIDDTWALSMLLKSTELDLKLVVTETGNTTYRAKIAARMLEAGGRTDVPVGIGIHQDDRPGPQSAWVEGYDLSAYPGVVHKDGVSALIDTIMESPEPLTLICIGPLPNVAAALEIQPSIAERSRFIGMHGCLRRGPPGYGDGGGGVVAEYNVVTDPRACRKVFTAPWDMTITPLDTCGFVRLTAQKYRAVRECKDPLVQALMENYRIWLKNGTGRWSEEFESGSSILFDTVAVYLSFSEELLLMERLGVRVTDDGYTLVDERSKAINCATGWRDLLAFESLLVKRLTGKKIQ
jgi:inosine-uridine nucleoside N-ribohydrolase